MAVHRNDRITSTFGVDTRELKEFIADLKRAEPAAAKGIRTVIKGAAEIVAAEARSQASEHSQSIPPTIKARTYLSGRKGSTATVTAGRGVPLAALYELGNKGSGGGRGAEDFRHPVFGSKTAPWVSQARYPFLLPAAEKKAPEVEAALEKTADTIAGIIAVRRLR